MNAKLKQVVLVTGGSRGIGKAISEQLIKNDYCVIIVSKDPERLYNTVKELRLLGGEVYGISYDLANVAEIHLLFEQVLKISGKNRIDALVHSAAIADIIPIRISTYEISTHIFNTNYFSFTELSRLYARQKFKSGVGKIVVISTMAVDIPSRGLAVYSASKAALETYCRVMSKEYAKRNITINGIRPAGVNTDMAKNMLVMDTNIDEQYPLGVLEPVDIANLVLFFLSDRSNKITGQFYTINGGLL